MQNDINEFVFKRKRKRLRIAIRPETVISLDQVSDGLNSGLIPQISVLSEPVTSSPASQDSPIPSSPGPEACSQSVVTVEKFLRSVQTVPRTKQAVSSAVSLRNPRTYIRHRPTGRRTMPVRKATKAPKRPRESSNIARNLFRAAVLTDGDPLNTLVDGAGISPTRRPLKFVPFDQFASPFELDQTRAVKPSDHDRGEDAFLRPRRLADHSDLKAHHHHSSSSNPRTPLCLVPLREAEAAYSVLFP